MARFIDYNSRPLPPKADLGAELISSITQLITNFPPRPAYDRHSCHGLYSGPTSIAYSCHHISQLHPDLSIGNKNLSSWCEAYLAGTRPKTEVTSGRCGIINETLAHLAVSAASSGNDSYAEKFLTYLPFTIPPLAAGASNEWLYGRAGTLYLLRLLRCSTSPHHLSRIDEATTAIIDRILAQDPPWYWHGKDYLGAAHGSIGILTQIILSSPTYVPRLHNLLDDLLAHQDPETGNWPSSPSSSSPNRIVQFCHGAPGFIISLTAIHPYIIDSALLGKIDTAIERGRTCIANRGLLTKQPSLCHGAMGNALAFDPKDERREVFLRWCQSQVVDTGLREGWFMEGDDASGLFCGEAGRAWGWCVATAKGGGLIGYSDV